MNRREKIIIYPYDIQSAPILRHKNLLEEYELVGLVSLGGCGFIGKDASYADGGKLLNIEINEKFEDVNEEYHTVLFTESTLRIDIEKDILSKMHECAKRKKNIINLVDIGKEFEQMIVKVCIENNVYYKEYYSSSPKNLNTIVYSLDESIMKIETPIILIAGMTQRTNKFEIQLNLRERIKKMGYKVSQVGSRKCCELMGFHSFPEFMYNDRLSDVEKIIQFNRFIRQIESEEKPDLIIIGVPGGMMKLSDTITNKFGIFLHQVSQALEPDVVVVSTFYEHYTQEYFERINTLAKYRFSFEIDCFNMSNTLFDWDSSKQALKEIYTTLSNDFIDNKLKNYNSIDYPIYNILNDEDSKNMADFIIEKLSEYSEIEVI